MAKTQIKFSEHAPDADFQAVEEWERKMKPKRRNSFLTDLKYDTKRKLSRHRDKLDALKAQWEDADNYFSGQIGRIIGQIDETLQELEEYDVSHASYRYYSEREE